jgi:hypothetical protein
MVRLAQSVDFLDVLVDGVAAGAVYQVLPEWEAVFEAVREKYKSMTKAGDNEKFAAFVAKMKNHRDKLDLDKQAAETFQPTTEAAAT